MATPPSSTRKVPPVAWPAVLGHSLITLCGLILLVYPSGLGFAFFLGTPLWLGWLGAAGFTLLDGAAALQSDIRHCGRDLSWAEKLRCKYWVGSNAMLLVVSLLDCMGATQLGWERFGADISRARAAEQSAQGDFGYLESQLQQTAADRRQFEMLAMTLNSDDKKGNDTEAAAQALLAEAARKQEAKLREEITQKRSEMAAANKQAADEKAGAHVVALWLVDAAESGNPVVWICLLLFFFALEWALGQRLVDTYHLWRYAVCGSQSASVATMRFLLERSGGAVTIREHVAPPSGKR